MENYGQVVLAVLLLVSTLACVFFACHGSNANSIANTLPHKDCHDNLKSEASYCFIIATVCLVIVMGCVYGLSTS